MASRLMFTKSIRSGTLPWQHMVKEPKVGRALALALCVVTFSCRSKPTGELPPTSKLKPGVPQSIPIEEIAIDDLPPGVREHATELSQKQARGLDGATVRVIRAYHLAKAVEDNPAVKWIAVDADFHIPGQSFDPDDVDIVNADTGENHGSFPDLHRLTAKGEFADWDDPVFSSPHDIRMLLIYAVPKSTKRISLAYWGKSIGNAVALEASGPIPRPESIAPLAYAVSGSARLPRFERHLLLLEARNWSRVAEPGHVGLVYRRGSEEELADADRWLEVDEKLMPLAVAVDARPFYLPSRRFDLEILVPTDGKVMNVSGSGTSSPLPKAKLVLPRKTESVLEAAPL
jgi:hypothetical protein